MLLFFVFVYEGVYMRTLKHTALALAMAGLLSAQANATQLENLPTLPVAAFSQTDINAMFEQADKPMQLAALSDQEMKETEGALLQIGLGGLGGGIGGAFGYYTSTTPSNRTWGGWATAVGTGAVGGAVASLTPWWPLASIWGSGIGYVGGWAATHLNR
ncbi:hypothetical protein D8B30_17315 [Verminephrobacter eiseniae]|nr:hypothetical protein [Verminephrobacter eiseniae]